MSVSRSDLSATAPATLPVALNLAARRVVVIGGGPRAVAALQTLLPTAAAITVFAPEPSRDMVDSARAGQITLNRGTVRTEDLRGAWLCVVAVSNPSAIIVTCGQARESCALLSVIDRPDLSDIIIPVVTGRSHAPGGSALGSNPPGNTPAAAASITERQGRASLVGAGPGDPELLTLRAVNALKSADVVLYDALIDPSMLTLAPATARRIDVGKRCGRHAMQQAAINRLIVRHADAGLHVVRLKGGDPFVFGRGGEELAELRAAGIAVEVIPGVTAACAAAARLGIPLTHRDIARSLHLVTGHGSNGDLPTLDWRAIASGEGTVAAYMAARTFDRLGPKLIAAGLPASTPAVAVENASRPGERYFHGTLAQLPAILAEAKCDGPTLLLIGQVVALSRQMTTAIANAA